jgi:hypothetical protein
MCWGNHKQVRKDFVVIESNRNPVSGGWGGGGGAGGLEEEEEEEEE